MKNIFISALLITALFTSNTVQAQLRKIPAEVTNSFASKFPDAAKVEWQDQLFDFKVAFVENGKNYKARFNNNGDWKMTERDIIEDYLPTVVRKAFSKSPYVRWDITQITIIKTPENDTQYKITIIKNKENKKDILFNLDGQLVNDNFTSL